MTDSSSLLVAPLLGWFTLLALALVAYLGRLEFLQRRRNWRMGLKRLAREQLPPAATVKRPLAMRHNTTFIAMHAECPIVGRTLHKWGRHHAFRVHSPELN